jgi:CubicO group peptidase (beta-lactamase class C family)
MTSFPYENAVEPASLEMDARKLASVVERFRQQSATGAFPGGQLVVRRNGKPVLNEVVGIARGYRNEEAVPSISVTPQTPFPCHSCGKPLAAIVVAMLEDRGKLDINAPISEVFPEFGRNGKEAITTLDVLTHRSGVLMPHLANQLELWNDNEAMEREVAGVTPTYPRGTLAYGPGEFGWILSEVVRRVDGRSLTEYFTEEIATPLRLPSLRFGLAGRALDSLSHQYWLGKDKVMVAGFNAAYKFEEMTNAKLFFDSLNPAFTLITDAASLAAFYDFILKGGVTASGERLISEQVLRQYTTRHVFGLDKSLKTFLAVGRGFLLGTLTPSFYGWWNTKQCFGHAGVFSCLAFGDYQTNLSVAIFTNGNRGIGDFLKRFLPMTHGIRKACL